MSIESWKEEFLPVYVAFVEEADAIEHSARHWHGVLPENLRKHGLARDGNSLVPIDGSEGRIWLTAQNCALCEHHFEAHAELETDDEDPGSRDCPNCPLVLAGHLPCAHEESEWKNAVARAPRSETEEREAIQAMIDAIESCAPRRYEPKPD